MKLSTITAVARALQRARCRYLVVGGMAVAAHGYGRLTNDLDIVIQLEPENVIRGLRALEKLGYHPRVPVTPEQFADHRLRESWIRGKGMIVLNLFSERHRETPIDMFVREPFDFDSCWEKALLENLSSTVEIRFVDIETLLALKRAAGRHKDLDDIEHLRLLYPIRKKKARG